MVEYRGCLKLPKPVQRLSRVPTLTRLRIVLALAIAVVADGMQLLLGPIGWTFADQAIDVVVMGLVSWLIGFHWLLLPTFVLELVPVLEDLPTWTACVIAVIVIRRREQSPRLAPSPPPKSD